MLGARITHGRTEDIRLRDKKFICREKMMVSGLQTVGNPEDPFLSEGYCRSERMLAQDSKVPSVDDIVIITNLCWWVFLLLMHHTGCSQAFC